MSFVSLATVMNVTLLNSFNLSSGKLNEKQSLTADKRQRYQERKHTQVCLSLYDGLSQTVHLSFQYCMAYNVFIRASDCEMCKNSRMKFDTAFTAGRRACKLEWERDSGPKGRTNQNCTMKEISKPSRKQQTLGHSSRLTKWNLRTLETGVHICVLFRSLCRRVSFYGTFFLRDFALTRLENLQDFSNLRDTARSNAMWRTRSVVTFVLCWGGQQKVTLLLRLQLRV
jgi:hypothetical protein